MSANVVDLDFPLVQLSENDSWTVRDAFEGTMVLGGTGSGKTSGSGHTFANVFLQAEFGGLVLTAKPDELAEWRAWANACGREDQLLVVHPAEPWYFDFMEYEARRENGSDTQTMVSLFMLIIEIANEGSIQSQETYWLLALRQMLRNAIDMLKCAGELITVETLYRLIVSAPTSVSRLGSDDWQQDSYCFRCLNAATDQYEALSDQAEPVDKPVHFDDFDIAFLYWTNEFPNLAEKTRSIIVSMFTTTADAFLRGTLKRLFVTDQNKRPAPPELARQGAIIVMDLNIKEHEDVGRIAQGVYKLMFQKANERQVASDSTPGVFLYADECQFFLNSYDLAFQQTARSSRVASFYLSQTLSNFHVGLGERGEQKANALLGNLSTKIFHANPDTTTNDWSAKLIGEDWSLQSSSSSSFDQQDEARMSTNLSEQKRHIIEPIEFTLLQRGGQPYDYTVSALIHQVGRTWSTDNNYLEVFFQQPHKAVRANQININDEEFIMQSISPKKPQKDNPNDWDQFTDMSEFLFNPVSKSVAFIEFLGTFIFNVLRMACVPAEVLFRRNFGERHFNLYLYVGGTLWLGIFATGWLNLPAGFGFQGLGLVSNTVIFAAVALLFYGRMAWLMFLVKSGDINVIMYSRYDGDPLPFLYRLPLARDSQGNTQEYRIRQLHEPLVMLCLGLIFSVVLNPQTGTWLILSAGCMAVKEYVKARTIRNLILDQIDADIIARNMADAIKGQPAKQTQGVYLAGVSNEGRDREILSDIAAKKAAPFSTDLNA